MEEGHGRDRRQDFFGMSDDDGAGGVAGDVEDGANHVEDPVHAEDEGKAFGAEADGMRMNMLEKPRRGLSPANGFEPGSKAAFRR